MTAEVRIYRPSKNAMQSGWANARKWAVEFEPGGERDNDNVMGWVSASDTNVQVRMRLFDTKDDAIAYAERQGYSYRVWEPKERAVKPKSYAANFAPDRVL